MSQPEPELRNGPDNPRAALHAGRLNSRGFMRELSTTTAFMPGNVGGLDIAGFHPRQKAEFLSLAVEDSTNVLILFPSPQPTSNEQLH